MVQSYRPAAPDRANRLRDVAADEVSAWRRRLGLTQADLGRILNVSQQQVGERLRGRMEFSLSELDDLADAFGIPTSWLLGDGPTEIEQPYRQADRLRRKAPHPAA